MFQKIKLRIERQLAAYLKNMDRLYSLSAISPLLFRSIKEFLCRKGKRIRPILFTVGYLGYKNREVPGLYESAISIELLHNFMLVHDDIIDKSQTRRGKPSMHAMLGKFLGKQAPVKFTGQDLAIVVGDVLYAMALDAFLSIQEDKNRKERALKKLITAALYTGAGEFIELVTGIKKIEKTRLCDIYSIYDLKTANYTFASPLAIGATLAGAPPDELQSIFKCGIYLGRAFQIKDDILGMFAEESKIGKPNLTDLAEGKKTLLVWYAYKKSSSQDKAFIKVILDKKKVTRRDFLKVRDMLVSSGALAFAKKEVASLLSKAHNIIKDSAMHIEYRNGLLVYTAELLKT